MNGKKFPRDTERINKDGSLRRIMVHGGWIVHSSTQYIYHSQSGSCSEALIFVPDPNYEWVLDDN